MISIESYLKLRHKIPDKMILISIIMIFCFSLILVKTSSYAVSSRLGVGSNYFVFKQGIFILMSLILMLLIYNFSNETRIRKFSLNFLIINYFILILTKFFGQEVNGAKRWIYIFHVSYQASEFVKPFFFVTIARILVDHSGFSRILFACITYLFLVVFLLMQPDFSTLLIISFSFIIQIFISRVHILWFLLFCASICILFFICYFTMPHIANRINNYLKYSKVQNYQLNQSIMSFKKGGFYGVGPGEGVIKERLPDAHTDFIFAVVGEEFGMVVCYIIVAIYFFIFCRIFFLLFYVQDLFRVISIIGIVSQIFIQIIVNIGVVLGVVPTTGLPLPFISYGGSSIVSYGISFAIIFVLLRKQISFNYYKKVRTFDLNA